MFCIAKKSCLKSEIKLDLGNGFAGVKSTVVFNS